MILTYNPDNREIEAEILKLNLIDLKDIDKSKRFVFKWRNERKSEVYKIVEVGLDAPLGLISFTDFPDEYRIHINLIENSNENKGRNKTYDKVAGCLLAFAVQISFEKGYGGFASLTPKTELIKLYINKYGFKQFGRQLALYGMDSINIINKYL